MAKKITAEDIESFFVHKHEKLISSLKKEPIQTKTYNADALIEASKLEIDRVMKGIRLPGHPKPFYMSVIIKDSQELKISAVYGTICQKHEGRDRSATVDIKVGSKKLSDFTQEAIWNQRAEDVNGLSLTDDVEPIRYSIWTKAEEEYRKVSAAYYNKQSSEMIGEHTVPKGMGVWTASPVIKTPRAIRRVMHDKTKAIKLASDLSAFLHSHPDVIDNGLEIEARTLVTTYCNSDGSEIVDTTSNISVWGTMRIKNKKGVKDDTREFYWAGQTLNDIPSLEFMIEELEHRIAAVRLAKKSLSSVKRYAGPTLMAGMATGTFFHEVVGHRLESGRLLSIDQSSGLREHGDDNGKVVSDLITFYDNPSIKEYMGLGLVGHFNYDEEGVKARKVTMLKEGLVGELLSSRTSHVKGPHKSSGHARSDGLGKPTARMGVSVVTASSPDIEKTWDELKTGLIKATKEAGLEFGVIIIDSPHGEATCDRSDIQAFRGETTIMLALFPDGRLEVLQPLDFAGTPLTALKSILAVGSVQSVENHGCGAESGWLKVSTVSCPLLLSSIELQLKEEEVIPDFILPRPK